jgi:transcriptional regulator with XRE-family HTH domain
MWYFWTVGAIARNSCDDAGVSDDWQFVADHVRARREQLGWTQAAAADASGVSEAVWNALENARQTSYKPRSLRLIATSLGWPPDGVDLLRHRQVPAVASTTDLMVRIEQLEERFDDQQNSVDELQRLLEESLRINRLLGQIWLSQSDWSDYDPDDPEWEPTPPPEAMEWLRRRIARSHQRRSHGLPEEMFAANESDGQWLAAASGEGTDPVPKGRGKPKRRPSPPAEDDPSPDEPAG